LLTTWPGCRARQRSTSITLGSRRTSPPAPLTRLRSGSMVQDPTRKARLMALLLSWRQAAPPDRCLIREVHTSHQFLKLWIRLQAIQYEWFSPQDMG
jgi:hypothetical protein